MRVVTPYLGRLAAWDRNEASLRPRPWARFEPDPNERSIIEPSTEGSESDELEVLEVRSERGADVETDQDGRERAHAHAHAPHAELGGADVSELRPESQMLSAHDRDPDVGRNAASGPADEPARSPLLQPTETRSPLEREPHPLGDGRVVPPADLTGAVVAAMDAPATPSTGSPNGDPRSARSHNPASKVPVAPETSGRRPATPFASDQDTADREDARERPDARLAPSVTAPEGSIARTGDIGREPSPSRRGVRQHDAERPSGTRRRSTPDAPAAEPTVRVSIGRIQVRVDAPATVKPPVASPDRSNHPRPSSLDDFLDASVARRHR